MLILKDAVERGFLRQALRQAPDRGLITRRQLQAVRLDGPAQRVFENLLRQVA